MGLVPFSEKFRFPTNDIPDLNDQDRSRIQLSDALSELEFKVANITNYFQNEEKLVDQITEVNLSFLSISFISF